MALFKAFYHMAAVGKSCFLADIGKVEVGEDKKFLGFINSHIFDIFLAGLSVDCKEFFCKIGVAHSALFGNFGDFGFCDILLSIYSVIL